MLNRREFIIATGAVALMPLGCGKVSQSELAALASTLGNAVAALETIEGNSGAAIKIQDATATVVQDITNWVPGTADSEIIQSIGILEGLLSDLPVPAQDQALIDLALVTIQSILALLPQAPAAAVTAKAVRMAKKPLRTPTAASVGLKTAPQTRKQFVVEWNKRAPTTAQIK